jgi:hypothetical protein
MQKITVTQQSGTRALLAALAAVSLILARRAACSTLEATRSARKWLCTRHDFMPADGDPIQCTGLQLIGCSLVFLALSFILSISF